jgi:hypothetical protein
MKTTEWATAALIAVLSVCAGVGAYKLGMNGYPMLCGVFAVVAFLMLNLLCGMPADITKQRAKEVRQAGSMSDEEIEDALLDLAMKAKDEALSKDLVTIAFCIGADDPHYIQLLRGVLTDIEQDVSDRAEQQSQE